MTQDETEKLVEAMALAHASVSCGDPPFDWCIAKGDEVCECLRGCRAALAVAEPVIRAAVLREAATAMRHGAWIHHEQVKNCLATIEALIPEPKPQEPTDANRS